MVSISSETSGMVDHSELIQVSGSFCLHWTVCLWLPVVSWSTLVYMCCTTLKNEFLTRTCWLMFLYPTQTFLNSSTCPEIHGHLHAKEQSRKSWKKFYFVLRRSGLYFSNKGTSKVSKTKSSTECCMHYGKPLPLFLYYGFTSSSSVYLTYVVREQWNRLSLIFLRSAGTAVRQKQCSQRCWQVNLIPRH